MLRPDRDPTDSWPIRRDPLPPLPRPGARSRFIEADGSSTKRSPARSSVQLPALNRPGAKPPSRPENRRAAHHNLRGAASQRAPRAARRTGVRGDGQRNRDAACGSHSARRNHSAGGPQSARGPHPACCAHVACRANTRSDFFIFAESAADGGASRSSRTARQAPRLRSAHRGRVPGTEGPPATGGRGALRAWRAVLGGPCVR